MFVPLRFQPAEAPREDAFQLLLECHERIRGFSALAVRLACLEDIPPHERAEAATRLERYFTVGLPRHVEDEDLSLAPRLVQARPAAEVLQALVEMTRQHAEIDAVLAHLVPVWRVVAATPERHAALATKLVGGSERLAAHMEEHLRLEEQLIFPAARSLLPPEDASAVLAELRARRAPGARPPRRGDLP